MSKSLSFVFSYRDREDQLNVSIPLIKKYIEFRGLDAELIIAEQNDQKDFRQGALMSAGATKASKDIIVCHDVDHIPIYNVTYWPDDCVTEVFLPIKKVQFVHLDLTELTEAETNEGYRHFKNGVDDDYWGAVLSITKEAFFKINGYPISQKKWGDNDVALRNRAAYAKLGATRGEGMFFGLQHKSRGLTMADPDMQKNRQTAYNIGTFHTDGVNNMSHVKIEEVAPKHPLVDKWLMVTNFDPPQNTGIVTSNWLSGR